MYDPNPNSQVVLAPESDRRGFAGKISSLRNLILGNGVTGNSLDNAIIGLSVCQPPCLMVLLGHDEKINSRRVKPI